MREYEELIIRLTNTEKMIIRLKGFFVEFMFYFLYGFFYLKLFLYMPSRVLRYYFALNVLRRYFFYVFIIPITNTLYQ